MSTINTLLSSQASPLDYSSSRVRRQTHGQKPENTQQLHGQMHGQAGSQDYNSGSLPTWSKLAESPTSAVSSKSDKNSGKIDPEKIDPEKIDIEDDDSHLLMTERLNNRILDEIKANGFDILAAIETGRADLFQDLFEEELNDKGNVADAITQAKSKMPGGMSATELKTILEDMIANGIAGVELPADVAKSLQEIVASIDIEMSDENLDKLLTGNEEEPASASFSAEKPIHTETPSTSNAIVGLNKNYTSEESYRIEALAYTKAQFEKENDLENNQEAKAMFDARLADNIAGKNRNDRSVNLMHHIV